MKNKIKIKLAKPRGFCAGVIRADETLRKILKKYPDKKIYVRKEIVHNSFVIKQFADKGVRFVNEVDEIPKDSITVYSAHGVSPYVRNTAQKRNLYIIDATCPFVERVHKDAVKYAKQAYHIIFIGHKNHEEAIGTTGESKLIQSELSENEQDCGKTFIINTEKEAQQLTIDDNKKIVCLTQTTLNIDYAEKIMTMLKKKFGDKIKLPDTGNICYATKNRQDALKNMIETTSPDIVFIVGSQNSSNSRRLVETAKAYNVNSFLIDGYKNIDSEWLNNVETIGISSGASAPEILIKNLIEYFGTIFDTEIEEIVLKDENVNFPLPV